MRIRTATQDDLDAICRVEAICFPASEAGTRESFAARLKVFPRHFLLLEDEGRLIGFVNGMVTDDRTISDVMFEQAELHKEDGKWQSVFGLDVLPEHRRKGYAGRYRKGEGARRADPKQLHSEPVHEPGKPGGAPENDRPGNLGRYGRKD